MDLPSILVSLGFLLFLVLIIKRSYKLSCTSNRLILPPPGPWRLPIIGSLHHLLGGLPHHVLRRLSQRHGPLMLLRLGLVDMLVASSPEVASEILRSKDLNFCSRPEILTSKVLSYDSTSLVFAPYGDYCRTLRKICTTELLSAKRIRSFHSVFEEETSNLISDINTLSTEQKVVNVSAMLGKTTNTIIARCAFGGNTEHQQRFIPASKQVLELASGLSMADLFPRIKYIDILSGARSKVYRLHRLLDEILEGILKEHERKPAAKLEKEEEKEEDDDDDDDLVDVLLRLRDNGQLEHPITNDNIKAVILDLFVAGSDTTSSVVSWAMSELIRNPQIMAKAQTEVRRVLKGKTKMEESDLGELHYLKFVIKETLRLYPPGPLLVPRLCTEACEVGGFSIPAGTRAIVNVWALGRDTRYWDDAEEFKPERFIGSSVDFRGGNFEFLPFGSGRRMCPGINFGSTTMGFILARLLLHFDWELPDGMMPQELDMTESFGLASIRKTDLYLVATPHSLPSI